MHIRLYDCHAQRSLDLGHGKSYGEVPVVRREDAELDVAEVAGTRRPIAHGLLGAIAQLVMPCEIENARRALFFGDRCAFRAQPIGEGRVAAAGIDNDIGTHVFDNAVAFDSQAFEQERAFGIAARDNAAHTGIVDERHIRQPAGITAHDEFECGAAAEQDRKIVVFRLRAIAGLQRWGQSIREAKDARA